MNTVKELNISQRTYNLLKRNNINTIEDLTKCSIVDLFKMRNIGCGTLIEIIVVLKNNNLSLKAVNEGDKEKALYIEERMKSYKSKSKGNIIETNR